MSFTFTHTSRALYFALIPNRARAASMKVQIGHGSSNSELNLGRSAPSIMKGKGTWTAEDEK